LFTAEDPEGAASKANADLTTLLNPASLEVASGCKVEPMLGIATPGARYQFERLGYFAVDPDSRPGTPVFNRTVSLKDSFKAGTP
jgi:glutaminyl-tRNA synthetase